MMLVIRGGAPRRVTINLDHGATLIARPLDTFELRAIAAEARAELNAIRAGEPTARQWTSISPERRDEAARDDDAAAQLLDWLHAVLTATACAEELHGVIEADGLDEATGEPINPRPLPPSFEAFELLFIDGRVEVAFRLQAMALERFWAAEKNASTSAPNGPGAGDTNSAAPAATPATPAPAAASATISQTESPASAPSAPTLPAPEKGSLPGVSPAAASGASPEAA